LSVSSRIGFTYLLFLICDRQSSYSALVSFSRIYDLETRKGGEAMRTTRALFSSKSVFAFILVVLCFTPAIALTPEISSVEPDHGANDSQTEITINGSNFEATPNAALYGGGFGSGPHIVGSVGTPRNSGLAVHVSGNYAYVSDGNLQVIDIADPTNPTIVGSADTPDRAYGVYVSDNYAYVADYESGLQVIDVSDPTNPTIVGSADTPGYARDVYVSGNYAYVADGDSGLQVIDISDPTNPTIVGSADTPDWAYGVHVSGNYAYIADRDSGLQAVDVSDPTNPTWVGSAETQGAAEDVYISGNYAYVANEETEDANLAVIDITYPTNPTIVGSADTTSGEAHGVHVSGNYAYVANYADLQVSRA